MSSTGSLSGPRPPARLPVHPTVALWYTPPPDSEPPPWGPGTEPRWVDVDVAIAPLIEQLWAADILTSNSCQGGTPPDDHTVICFARLEDCRRFMRVVLAARCRMPGRHPISMDTWTARYWHESIHWNHDENPNVRFRPADIPEVEARIRWWNHQ